MLAALGHEAVGIQADTFARLVGGQIAETIGPQPGQDPLQHYLHVVKDKTASLVATSGRFGAMYSGAPDEVVARIEPACEAIGVAWQLSDDILDVASDSDQSGKTPGPTCARACGACRCSTRWPPAARPMPGCASCLPPLT